MIKDDECEQIRMTRVPGTKQATYETVSAIGVAGMSEVAVIGPRRGGIDIIASSLELSLSALGRGIG